jgi:hypothetical protein
VKELQKEIMLKELTIATQQNEIAELQKFAKPFVEQAEIKKNITD